MADVDISVVIATLGRPQRLAAALEALSRCDPPPHEVLVVDGADDESARPVVEAVASATSLDVRHLTSARGSSHQRNAGIRACSGDVVLFLDDDADVAPDVFGRFAEAYADPAVVGVTGRIIEPAAWNVGAKESRIRRLLPGGGADGQFTSYGYPRRLTRVDQDRDVEFMQGCFMSARANLALAVGFDESMPGYALAEDEDFSYRLSRHGRIRYLAAAVVHHDSEGFQSRDRRAFGRLVVTRRAYLVRKNFAPTARTWLGFAGLVLVLVGHRLVNRDLLGAVGLLEGSIQALRER